MTVSRRDWRGSYDAGTSGVHVEAFTVFGWKVHQHIMPPGSKLITISSQAVERTKAANITLTVRGRGIVTGDDGTAYPDRVPGMFSPERGDVPKGAVTTLADTELEFWCFNWTANRGALPQAQALRITEDQNVTLPHGLIVLVCRGGIGGHFAGESFVADGSPLQAAPATYGFLIGGARV